MEQEMLEPETTIPAFQKSVFAGTTEFYLNIYFADYQKQLVKKHLQSRKETTLNWYQMKLLDD